jgi:hypothetical protein
LGCASNPFGFGLLNCTSREIRYLNTSDGLIDDFITTIRIFDNTVFLGTNKGFSILDLRTETIVLSENEDDYHQEFSVNCIEYYPFRERIYVGTDTGLLVYEIQDGQTTLIDSRFTTVNGLPNNKINCLSQDEQRKRVYIGTREGVSYINLDEDDVAIHTLANSTQLYGYNVRNILIPRYEDYIVLGANGYLASVPESIITLPTSFSRISTQMTSMITFGGFALIAILIMVMVIYPEFTNYRHSLRKTYQKLDYNIDSKDVAEWVQKDVEEPLLEIKSQINISSNREKAEFIRDMAAMANRCLANRERGLIVVGPKPTGYQGSTQFLDDANYQEMVNSKLRKKIVFNFKPLEYEGIPYGAFIIQPHGTVPIITKKWADKEGPIFKDGECWLREGTKKTLLNQEDYALLAQEIARLV